MIRCQSIHKDSWDEAKDAHEAHGGLLVASRDGDALERLSAIVDFELFRRVLARAVPRSDVAKGGRPPFNLVLIFKVLILQASHSLSDGGLAVITQVVWRDARAA